MPNFWALKNLQKGKQVCWLNLNRRTRTEHYQVSSDCFCSYLNQATPKNTWQVLLPKENPGSKIFFCCFFFWGGGRFGLKTGIDLAYQVWFSRELRECTNVFIISVSNVRKKEKYANSKWILKHLFCCCSKLRTVMIRFSTRGAYLLLVPQGRALISLLRNNRMLKTKL